MRRPLTIIPRMVGDAGRVPWVVVGAVAGVIATLATLAGLAIAAGVLPVRDRGPSTAEQAILDALSGRPGVSASESGQDARGAEEPLPSTRAPSTQATPVPPATVISSPSVALGVVKHCFCGAPRSQLQVKIKPTITNLTDDPLPLATRNLRLLVPSPLRGPWTPPRTSESVTTVEIGDASFEAIPANPDRAAESYGGGSTFASHWTASMLGGNATFFDPDVKQGDLVFYVPTNSEGTAVVIGLAYMNQRPDGRWVVQGFVGSGDWSGEDSPNLF